VGSYLAVLGGIALLAIGPADGASPGHRPAGIVPRFDRVHTVSATASCDGPSAPECGNLAYHGGPVMHSSTVYTIFWLPTGYTSWDGQPAYSANYQSLIARFFQDLEADSGRLSKVYGAATQYCDGAAMFATSCTGVPAGNHITTNVTYGGSWTDTQAFPASGCTDPTGNDAPCLTDAQLRSEIQHAISTNGLGWTASATHIFFVYTPRGVSSCFDSFGTCSYSVFCAYHSNSGNGSNAVIYANMPYPVYTGFDFCEDEGNPQHPNGDAPADIVLSTTSHEHNEAITEPEVDPEFTGWYDDNDFVTGAENADKCSYWYGKSSGPNGAKHNQTINGHDYYLQLEWSNADRNCVASVPGPSVTKLSPSHGVVGQAVTVKGKNLTDVTAVTFNGTPATSFVVNGKKLTAVPAPGTTTGPVQVTTSLAVADGPTFTVDPSPAPQVKSFKPAGTTVGGTVTLMGSNLWGTSAVKVNGVDAQSFTVTDAKKLTFVVAAGTTSGTVLVTTPGGTAVSTTPLTVG